MLIRFKTKQELFLEFGREWRDECGRGTGYYWTYKMDEFFGRSYFLIGKQSSFGVLYPLSKYNITLTEGMIKKVPLRKISLKL